MDLEVPAGCSSLSKLDEFDVELGINHNYYSSIDDMQTKRQLWKPRRIAKKKRLKRERSNNSNNRTYCTLTPVNTQSQWDEYLKFTGYLPQDVSCFPHLNFINNNQHSNVLFQDGLWLIVCHEEKNFWPAQILQVCGGVIRMQWFGAASTEYFWCDVKTKRGLLPIHMHDHVTRVPPISLHLPHGPVGDMIKTMGESFCQAPTVDFDVLQAAKNDIPDEFREGTIIHMQHSQDPTQVYRASVLEYKGGYLFVHPLDWLTACNKPLGSDLWVFCTSLLIHALNWVYSSAAKEHRINVTPPDSKDLSEIIECEERVKRHEFIVGMKMELLDDTSRTRFVPATVVQIISPFYFVIVPDSYSSHLQTSVSSGSIASECNIRNCEKGARIVCHRDSGGIFPVNWCSKNGLRISPPTGWPTEEEFSWSVYLQVTGGISSHESLFNLDELVNELVVDRTLEVVDCESNEHLTVTSAIVTRTLKHLVWIRLTQYNQNSNPTRIYDCRCASLLACGWATTYNISMAGPHRNTNTVQFHASNDTQFACKPTDIHSIVKPHTLYMPKRLMPPPNGKCGWSPMLYINPDCYCGPHLNMDSVLSIPKIIGAGPLSLVLQKVVKLLVSCAYRPKEVLHDLLHPPSRNIIHKSSLVEVKVRLKTRRFRGNVQICTRGEDLQEWMTHLLAKLDACPSLFSLVQRQTDTKCVAQCYNIRNCDLAVHKPLLKKSCKRKLTKRLRRPSRLVEGGTGRRFVRIKPDRSLIASHINRKRNKPVAIVEGRRPVTRGIKLPRPGQMKRPGVEIDHTPTIKRASNRKLTQVCAPFPMSTMSNKPLCAVKPATNLTNASPSTDISLATSTCSMTSQRITSTISLTSLNEHKLPPVESNPQHWTVEDLCLWLMKTDSHSIVPKLREELVDGQAFLLLTLDECRQYLGLKFGPALKLTGIIESLKEIFIEKYECSITK